jgi:hypothetical protein
MNQPCRMRLDVRVLSSRSHCVISSSLGQLKEKQFGSRLPNMRFGRKVKKKKSKY